MLSSNYDVKDCFVVATDGEIELVREKQARDDYFYFYIRLCNTNEIIGNINYRPHDDDEVYCGNVGYYVKPAFRGNNYALKALRLLKGIIEEYGYTRMVISVEPNNKPSLETAKKFGAKLLCYRPIPKGHSLYKLNSEHQVVVFTYDVKKI